MIEKLEQSPFWLNVFVAFLYGIAAHFSLMFAIPPGFGSPIWPASGIALGALIIWGLRLLPGIFVAAFLMNLYAAVGAGGAFSWGSNLLAGLGIAFGATLQAYVGYRLFSRYVGFKNTLDAPKDIWKFAFLTGPLSSITSTTIGNITLLFTGIISSSYFLLSWGSWWIGDCVGVLLFCPIMMILFKNPKAIWRKKVLTVALPLMMSFIFVFIGCYAVSIFEFGRLEKDFNRDITSITKNILYEVKRIEHITEALGHEGEVGGFTTKENFTQRVNRWLRKDPYLAGILFIKPQSEKQFKNPYTLKIMSLNGHKGHDFQSGVDFRRFPVKFVLPYEAFHALVGKDLSDDRSLFKVLIASEVYREVMAAPVNLAVSEQPHKGLFLIYPVFNDDVFDGFIVSMMNIDKMIGDVLNKYKGIGYLDIRANKEAILSWSHESYDQEANIIQYATTFKILNARWVLHAVATHDYIIEGYTWIIWAMLLLGFVLCIILNITFLILSGQKHLVERKVEQKAKELESVERKNLLLLDSAGDGICGVNNAGMITFLNPSAERLLGYSEDELVGKSLHEMIYHSTKEGEKIKVKDSPLYQTLHDKKIRHVTNQVFWNKNGDNFLVEYTCSALIHEDKIEGGMIVFTDITQKIRAQAEIEEIARTDVLTGIPNRSAFQDLLPRAIARAARSHTHVAVVFIGIDNFKKINDNFSYETGDEVLKIIPKLLVPVLRETDAIARLGSDEFGVILESIRNIKEVQNILARYSEVFNRDILVADLVLNISVSMGVTIFPENGTTAEDLMNKTDVALYRAKEAGQRKIQFFDERTNLILHRRHDLVNALHGAVQNNELFLLYQPQVNLHTQKLVGVEALMRWRNPDLGLIMPHEFIEIAEEHHLMDRLGYFLLEKSFQDYEIMTKHPALQKLKLSINLSLKEIESTNYVENLKMFLERYNISPLNLVIEITETQAMKDTEKTLRAMEDLKKLSVQLALDDFGTGYSSMQYLKNFPIKYLKIDQVFIRDIPQDKNDSTMVKAIVQMARSLDLTPLAEGVESSAHIKFLKEIDCNLAQGFYIGQPMTVDELLAWYQSGDYQ